MQCDLKYELALYKNTLFQNISILNANSSFYLVLFKMHSMENIHNCQIFIAIYTAFLF